MGSMKTIPVITEAAFYDRVENPTTTNQAELAKGEGLGLPADADDDAFAEMESGQLELQ